MSAPAPVLDPQRLSPTDAAWLLSRASGRPLAETIIEADMPPVRPAEYRVQTSGRGRTVYEWKMRPEQSDNHWLDGLVGCAVGASMQGTSLLGEKASGVRNSRLLPCQRMRV